MNRTRRNPGFDAACLRPEVLAFEPYSPGLSIEEIRRTYGIEQVVKLASNENPLGVSPVVQKTLADRAGYAFRYPQAGNPRLVQAIADNLGVAPECVVAGNGSDEIIDLLIRVRARPGRDTVLAFAPCFSMYKLQARLCGVAFNQTPLAEDLSFPFDRLLAAVDGATAVVFVTNPDNPSGHAVPADELADVASRLPRDCLLVVDEAYVDFAVPRQEYTMVGRLEGLPNVVVLRTFSKMYGLAGLRVGYGVMDPGLADYLWRVRLPFSVNILAEEAALAALDDQTFYQATLDTVLEGRETLSRELETMGCNVHPSQANFVLFRLPEASGLTAKEAFEALLAKGVIVRPLASYGLPAHLRVSVGTRRENGLFLQALREVLGA